MKKWTGKGITKLREQLGLTVTEFAAVLGVSVASAYRWEARKTSDVLETGATRQVLDAFAAAVAMQKREPTKFIGMRTRVREGLYNLILRGLT